MHPHLWTSVVLHIGCIEFIQFFHLDGATPPFGGHLGVGGLVILNPHQAYSFLQFSISP